MTNYENYKESIEKITRLGLDFAFDKSSNRIILCNGFSCSKCLFNSANLIDCDERKIKWADEEYKESEVDWSKVAVDTPILVRNEETVNWQRRHFAKFEHGKIYTWVASTTSWSAQHDDATIDWLYAKLAEVDE